MTATATPSASTGSGAVPPMCRCEKAMKEKLVRAMPSRTAVGALTIEGTRVSHVEAANDRTDGDRDHEPLEGDRDRGDRVEVGGAELPRGRDRHRRDRDRAEAVQAQLLPDVLRAQEAELQEQHDDRDDARGAAEERQVHDPVVALQHEHHDRKHGQQEACDRDSGIL